MANGVEFEYKIIPAQADEIGLQYAEVLGDRRFDSPLAVYLLNISGVKGLHAVGLVAWEDRNQSRSLAITNFYNMEGSLEIGSMVAVTHNLLQMLDIELQAKIKKIPGLKNVNVDTHYSYSVSSSSNAEASIGEYKTWIAEDPWYRSAGYVRDRLASTIVIPGKV